MAEILAFGSLRAKKSWLEGVLADPEVWMPFSFWDTPSHQAASPLLASEPQRAHPLSPALGGRQPSWLGLMALD